MDDLAMVRDEMRRRGLTTSALVALSVIALAWTGRPAMAAPAADAGSGPVYVEGTGAWDIELVREYIKKGQEVDMAPEPQAYPGQDLLARLNPEFARRIEALMAVYQAHGGGDLGIVPRSGGLRTPQEQIDLFRKCRQIRTGADGKPVGDGSQKAHWEEIPAGDRTPDGKVFTKDPATGKVTGQALSKGNCPVLDYNADLTPKLGPVTDLWVGWHNLGLAVDFATFVNGRYTTNPLPEGTPAWSGMTQASADLGMIRGAWWSEPDPPHIEWHPKLRDPENVPGGVSGTALADANIDAGYGWKIPETIFTWTHDPANPQKDVLLVVELGADGGWIVLKKQRSITGAQEGDWLGAWATFDPPIRLFPAYMPTVGLERNEARWPEDSRWRGKTEVTLDTHQQWVADDRVVTSAVGTQSGRMIYSPELHMTDLQKTAIARIGQKLPQHEKYRWLSSNSVYSLQVAISPVQAGAASMQTITSKGRQVDSQGYTHDGSGEEEGWLDPHTSVRFSWNRDTGKVGVEGDLMLSSVAAERYQVEEQWTGNRGRLLVVSDALPEGAWDVEKAPSWPMENRKLEEKSEADGFLPR